MGLFTGKKGMVFGIANDHSIAWAITEKLFAEGAEIGF
ncbi:MAG: enoyl-[acyl-carrier-protein] reductase FabI, partial [Planctomycetaceae bacterium]